MNRRKERNSIAKHVDFWPSTKLFWWISSAKHRWISDPTLHYADICCWVTNCGQYPNEGMCQVLFVKKNTSSDPRHGISRHIFWNTYILTYDLTYIQTFYLRFYLTPILTFYLPFFLAFYLVSIRAFYLAFYLASFLVFYLAFYLTSILTFYLGFSLTFSSGNLSVRILVWRETLWSRGCCSGPAGTLRSSACSSGWAENTLIHRLLFGSGGEHCDLALAVDVRRGTLWSWPCCWGPAGNTAI